jgi:hypothetical protein
MSEADLQAVLLVAFFPLFVGMLVSLGYTAYVFWVERATNSPTFWMAVTVSGLVTLVGLSFLPVAVAAILHLPRLPFTGALLELGIEALLAVPVVIGVWIWVLRHDKWPPFR